MANECGEGLIVKDSPVGPGVVDGYSERGFPMVNGVTVAWAALEDGRTFDPYGVMQRDVADRASQAAEGGPPS